MILKFPDFSLTFEDFLISLTILQNTLTYLTSAFDSGELKQCDQKLGLRLK